MKRRKFIRRTFDKWIYRLGLRWWDITILWYDKPKMINKEFKNPDICARTYVDWRYSEATITVNMPKLSSLRKEKIERAIVHELLHIPVNEMRETGIHHEERVVTTLQKAIFWTMADIKAKK